MWTRVRWASQARPRLACLCPAPQLNQEAEEEVVLAKEKAVHGVACHSLSLWGCVHLLPVEQSRGQSGFSP